MSFTGCLVRSTLSLSLFTLSLTGTTAAHALDAYQTQEKLSGELVIRGSGTVGKAAKVWVKAFSERYPNVKIDITEAGSGDGAKAVIGGSANIGNMSRKMKSKEVRAFENKFGYKPTEIRVGVDAVGVVVHKDNPVKSMSLAQIDALFSTTASCGGNVSAKWADVGVEGTIGGVAPKLNIRNPGSGTRAFFKKKALCGGEFKATANEFVHSNDLVASVRNDEAAIGFISMGKLNDSVKTVAVSKGGRSPVSPDMYNVSSGKYPLSRYLYMYVNRVPGQPLDPHVKEFIKFVVSNEGQAIVSDVGYVPINDRVAASVKKFLY